MFFLVFLTAGVSAAAYIYRTHIKEIVLTVRYEAIYWLLGGAAMVDDLLYSRRNRLKDLPKRSNEVAVVTGGSRGIGLEVVKKLLQCDMHVIIGCRKVQAGHEAIKKLRQHGIKSGNVDVVALDTSSMASVKKFAGEVLSKCNQIHLLVNNAGIMFVPHTLTEDGFESQLCVNYIGHFLLTHLLLPTMKETGIHAANHTRVVNVSSCAHIPGSINFEDINYTKSLYIPTQAYAQSKLAQLMFSNAIERRMRSEGARVSSYALHPGVVDTELFDGTILKRIAPWAPRLFFKTPEQGAVTIIFACLSDTLEARGGTYLANCREMWTSFAARNVNQQERLMNKTLEMLNIEDFSRSSLHYSSKLVNNNK